MHELMILYIVKCKLLRPRSFLGKEQKDYTSLQVVKHCNGKLRSADLCLLFCCGACLGRATAEGRKGVCNDELFHIWAC